MLYGAGERALRFRLHPHVSERALDALFDRLDESLSLLASGEDASWREVALPDQAPPWPPTRRELADGLRIESVDTSQWADLRSQVAALQALCYEPARRDDLALFGAMLEDPGAIFLVAVEGDGALGEAPLVGTAFALPLELVSDLDGPMHDPMLGRGNTVYSADVTVHPDHRGRGLGVALKEAQVRAAMAKERSGGGSRYSFMTGRNRVGETEGIQRINGRFGAWPVSRHLGQYGDPDGEALYYRIPLAAPRLTGLPEDPPPGRAGTLDLASGLDARLGDGVRRSEGYEELARSLRAGTLNGALANKLSLGNFITPNVSRAAEWLRAMAPEGLRHLFVVNGRAETVDTGLRAIKYHRPAGAVAIAVGPVWGGRSTAASRSLSLAGDHADNTFGWPTTSDPCDGVERAMDEARRAIDEAGADRVLALVLEPVYQATGRAVPQEFWPKVRALANETGVPLVVLENASASYRSGLGAFRSATLPVPVDALWWYPGGQAGFVFLSDSLYVPDKLTLISTWAGDEVALTRMLWDTRVARRMPVAQRAARLRSDAGAASANARPTRACPVADRAGRFRM
jgi:GNAT superfamily N-acetyltransferase